MKYFFIKPTSNGRFTVVDFEAYVKVINLSMCHEGELKWVKKGDRVYFYEPDRGFTDSSRYESEKLKKFIEKL